MRLIDADAFDSRIRAAGGMVEEDLTDDFKDGVLAALDMLKTQPTVQAVPQWIPVSERLPKPYEQVLRTVKTFGWESTFHIHVDIGTICPIDTDVIAWMPLPEPYKAESEDKE